MKSKAIVISRVTRKNLVVPFCAVLLTISWLVTIRVVNPKNRRNNCLEE